MYVLVFVSCPLSMFLVANELIHFSHMYVYAINRLNNVVL